MEDSYGRVSKSELTRFILSVIMLLFWIGLLISLGRSETSVSKSTLILVGFASVCFFIIFIVIVDHISFLKLSEYRKVVKKTALEARRKTEIITSLFDSYDSLFYFDLESETIDIISLNPIFTKAEAETGSRITDVDDFARHFAELYIYPKDKDDFLANINLIKVKEEIRKYGTFVYTFLIDVEGTPTYVEMKAVISGVVGKYGYIGFAIVDDKVRESMRESMLLKESMDQAVEANKTKDTFLSNVSHELKTPLNAIVAYASLIGLDEDGKEKSAEYSEEILKETDKLLRAVDNLLDMSMIKNGEMVLDDYLNDMDEVIGVAVENLKPKAKSTGVRIHVTKEISHPEVFCDGLKFGEIVEKILDNAVTYSHRNSDVYLSFRETACLNDRVLYELTIRDEGIGMDEEFLDSIFDPFEREKDSTNGGILGVGLGMSIVKYYLDLMNGTIDIKSKKDEGTLVTVKVSFKLNS